MTLPYDFSLQETNQKIFLHAVDGHFENMSVIDKNCHDVLDDFNVKFLLSLDNDANFNDISTELNSEGEESLNRDNNLMSLKDSCLDLNIEVESQKLKISEFLDYSILKTEIDKIKNDTVKSLRLYQMQIYNKMLTMMRSGQSIGTFGNSFNVSFLENKNK